MTIALTALGVVYVVRGGDVGEFADALDALGAEGSEAREILESISDLLPDDASPPPDPAPEGTSGNLEILFTGPSPRDHRMVDRLRTLIESADETLWCAWYDVGYEPIADALIERHRAGVDVRIVTDDRYKTRAALAQCKAAGIPFVLDSSNALMHNKFCIVDGHTVWTGSTNISSSGFFKNNNNALVIPSQAIAENYTAEFREMYERKSFGPSSPASTPHRTVEIGDVIIENYFAPEDNAQRRIIELVRGAKETIDFMTFAFTADPISAAMIDRMRAGVRVRGVFEARNSNDEHAEDDRLRDAGATIVIDSNPNAMHHKTVIIDDRIVITGSYNLSRSAEERNDENIVILHSDWIAAEYTAEFGRVSKL